MPPVPTSAPSCPRARSRGKHGATRLSASIATASGPSGRRRVTSRRSGARSRTTIAASAAGLTHVADRSRHGSRPNMSRNGRRPRRRSPPPRAQGYERPEREAPPPPPPPRSGRRRAPEEEPVGGYDREPRRRSGLGRLVFFILVLAVLGGGAFFIWSQWPKVSALISMFDSGSAAKKPAKTTTAAPAPAPAAEPSTKDSDRLLPGEPPKTVRTVDSTPAPAAGGSDAESLPGAPDATAPDAAAGADDASADAGADAAPDAAAAPAPTTETASTDDGGGAADTTAPQKAILYEEPLNAAGAATGVTAINANVAWKFVPNGPNGPEIEADLQVPERAMKVKFSLRRNSDKSLPASHLVEVVIDIPGDFPGKGIRSVPRIVMKPTEEARGQPLIGAAAKVADGFFWIALSAAAADVTTNLDLLKSQDWIDLPFVYETGQRAILTFEKGSSGDQVFQKAVAAWSPS